MTPLEADTLKAPGRGTTCRRPNPFHRDLLGRVIDSAGQFINGLGLTPNDIARGIEHAPAGPCRLMSVSEPFATGVRAIDGLLTCGRGQRIGILADPESYKPMLLAWLAKHSSAQVAVIALIGVSARDVRHFIEARLGPDGLARCVVVASTVDDPPVLRARAAKLACAVAQRYCVEGKNVLLLVDSLTRLLEGQVCATAQLNALVGSAGTHAGGGSVTAFYAVDIDTAAGEGVASAVTGRLDGYIRLDARLAECGYFPPIDVLNSAPPKDQSDHEHREAARVVRKLLADYAAIEELLNICACRPGASLEADLAVKTRQAVLKYLQQSPQRPSDLAAARDGLLDLKRATDSARRALTEGMPGNAGPAARILRPPQWADAPPRALAG